MRTFLDRFESKFIPEPMSGCWLWDASQNRDGYGNFRFRDKILNAHRVAWYIYRGAIPRGVQVLHKCDIRSCVNPQHLYLGSQRDNVLDCENRKRARHPKGDQHKNAKISEKQAIYIFWDSRPQHEIARDYKISQPLVSSIKNQKAWTHIFEDDT